MATIDDCLEQMGVDPSSLSYEDKVQITKVVVDAIVYGTAMLGRSTEGRFYQIETVNLAVRDMRGET